MSSEIYYGRAYIAVGDSIIPIVNHGSSNCFEIDYRGREVAEKHWHTLNCYCRNKVLYTKDEILEVANRYEEINTSNRGGVRKSRNREFEVGEFRKWILAGMKHAYTVEEYTQCGNRVLVRDCSVYPGIPYPVSTTEELLDKLEQLKECPDVDVSFEYNRGISHPRKKKNLFEDREFFYVIKNRNLYFERILRRRFVFTEHKYSLNVRRFASEKAAQNYLGKYPVLAEKCDIVIERVVNNEVKGV